MAYMTREARTYHFNQTGEEEIDCREPAVLTAVPLVYAY